jgi:hypothetical protein
LEITWQQAGASQLAAPNLPPAIESPLDLKVQLHESFVGNFSRAMLGGVSLSDERLVEILKKNKIEVPEALELSQDKPSWTIVFSPVKPVSASFDANTIRFAIRGRRFELGERVVNRELEMSAVYNVQKTPGGARFIRQGDVSVEYLGNTRQLKAEEIAVRTVMREKFEALFVPEFETTGIQLPGRWQGGVLNLEHLVADQGWLHLAWNETSNPKTP